MWAVLRKAEMEIIAESMMKDAMDDDEGCDEG